MRLKKGRKKVCFFYQEPKKASDKIKICKPCSETSFSSKNMSRLCPPLISFELLNNRAKNKKKLSTSQCVEYDRSSLRLRQIHFYTQCVKRHNSIKPYFEIFAF